MKTLIVTIVSLSLFLAVQAQYPSNPTKLRMDLEKQYTTGLFKSDNAYTFVPDEEPGSVASFSILQYLQGRVPGLMIEYDRFNIPFATYRNARPAFFLDEMQVDARTMWIVPMSDIAYVKVFRPPFVGAIGNGPGGAIVVYTHKGEEE
jgi:hypothetical protein